MTENHITGIVCDVCDYVVLDSHYRESWSAVMFPFSLQGIMTSYSHTSSGAVVVITD